MPLCPSVYMCLVVTCWERADLLALVCGVLLWVCYFPIGILGQVWYLIVLIPDLCTLPYFAPVSELNLCMFIDFEWSLLLRCRKYGTTESVIVTYAHRYAKFWHCTCSPINTGIWYLLWYKSNTRVVCLKFRVLEFLQFHAGICPYIWLNFQYV